MSLKSTDKPLVKGEVLTAVIIADSFNQRFGHLTQSLPKCLLPLANRPLIDYTLEMMKLSGIQDVYVYCTSLSSGVSSYIAESHWSKQRKMQVSVVTNEDCHSFGDAIRDLDSKGLLRDHFILTTGDVVGNVNLAPLVKEHKMKCSRDKEAMMTLVYKRAKPGHHCRTTDEELVIAASKASGRILHHAKLQAPPETTKSGKKKDDRRFQFPSDCFLHECVELRFDLLDPGIAICSPGVPSLFSDIFDSQSMDDVVKGVIEDDLTNYSLYADVIEGHQYVARVANYFTYLEITRDVLNRFTYPVVPEMVRGSVPSPYRIGSHSVYKTADIVLKSGSTLEKNVIMGPGCLVDENSKIRDSAIGSNCYIGSNVVIQNCIIHDSVKIGDDCELSGCVIGENVIIGDSVTIGEKCVLGPGVQIKSHCRPISKATWLMAERGDDNCDGSQDLPSEFGPRAYLYSHPAEDVFESDSEEDFEGGNDALSIRQFERNPLETLWGMVEENRPDNDEDEGKSLSDSEESDMSGFDEQQHMDIIDDEDAKYQVFHSEVLESLQRGAREGINETNLVLEVNSSRHAYAVTSKQVIQSVVVSILTIATDNSEADGDGYDPKSMLTEARKQLKAFRGLLLKYIKTLPTQVDCLKAIVTFCRSYVLEFVQVAAKVIHSMYEMDVVSEDAIIQWYGKDEEDLSDSEEGELEGFDNELFREKLKPLIQWLEEQSEESDSD